MKNLTKQLTYKTANSPTDWRLYKKVYNEIGYPVDLWYLQKCYTVKMFFKNGDVVGGYCLNKKFPYRFDITTPWGVIDLDLKHCCECCCIFFKTEMTTRERYLAYLLMFRDYFLTRKSILIGGTTQPKVATQHMRALPHLLYRGPGNAGADIQLFYGSRWDLLIASAKILWLMLRNK